MIALGLASALLTVLFQFLVSNTRFELGIERAQATLRQQQRLHEKIDSFFLSICPADKGPIFYTAEFPSEKSISLVARFDAGIDPDPAYSGPNTARLFVDEQNRLCFTQWPLEKAGHRTEILLENVHAIEWEFLGPSLKKDQTIWLKKWNANSIPSLIRLKVWHGIDKKKQREPNLQIAFILPRQDPIQIIKDS